MYVCVHVYVYTVLLVHREMFFRCIPYGQLQNPNWASVFPWYTAQLSSSDNIGYVLTLGVESFRKSEYLRGNCVSNCSPMSKGSTMQSCVNPT